MEWARFHEQLRIGWPEGHRVEARGRGLLGRHGGGVGADQSGPITAAPGYVDRASKDFRLREGSACAGKGAPASVAGP